MIAEVSVKGQPAVQSNGGVSGHGDQRVSCSILEQRLGLLSWVLNEHQGVLVTAQIDTERSPLMWIPENVRPFVIGQYFGK